MILLPFFFITGFVVLPYLPDPQETPGKIDPQCTVRLVCQAGYTKRVRPSVSYTTKVKMDLIRKHHLSLPPSQIELDHRVPLEVCGAPRDRSNLWAEPRVGPWSASEKDQLENFIHEQVCHEKMNLKEGQSVFLSPDWTVEYRKYLSQLTK